MTSGLEASVCPVTDILSLCVCVFPIVVPTSFPKAKACFAASINPTTYATTDCAWRAEEMHAHAESNGNEEDRCWLRGDKQI